MGYSFGIDKELCLKTTENITVAAIQAGILSGNVDDVAQFFSSLYSRIFPLACKALDKFEQN